MYLAGRRNRGWTMMLKKNLGFKILSSCEGLVDSLHCSSVKLRDCQNIQTFEVAI